MPIVSADIKFKLSIKTGSAGNSSAQADPNASLGKYISTTEISATILNNLWDNITGDENAGSDVEYRCVFVHNNHGSLTMENAVVWISGKRCTADAGTDVITSTAHGFTDGQAVRCEAEYATDAIPSGLNNSTTYYVRDAAANTFKLAASAGGAAIDIGASSGFCVRKYFGALEAIAIDSTAASAIGASSAQALDVADESTAPAGPLSFSSPTTKAAGLSLGNILAGYCRAIWQRRTAQNNGAFSLDGLVLRVECDTAA